MFVKKPYRITKADKVWGVAIGIAYIAEIRFVYELQNIMRMTGYKGGIALFGKLGVEVLAVEAGDVAQGGGRLGTFGGKAVVVVVADRQNLHLRQLHVPVVAAGHAPAVHGGSRAAAPCRHGRTSRRRQSPPALADGIGARARHGRTSQRVIQGKDPASAAVLVAVAAEGLAPLAVVSH